jgi:gliding motility-associated-like protein
VPVLQNTARPKVIFSGAAPISCKVGTLTLTNQSTSNVPAIFNPTAPVVGYLWQGPSPEDPLQLKTTYVGSTPGVYTLTGKDLNNGCIGSFTALVADDRDFPVVSAPESGAFIFDCGAPGATIFPVVSGSTNNLQYVWQPRSDVAFSSLTTATTVVNKTGHFDIVVTNTLNGCMGSGFIEVEAGTLTADFVADPDTGYAPLTVNFTNLSASSSTLNGKNNIQSTWSFGNGKQMPLVAASVSPSTVYQYPGIYTVKLFVGKGQCQAELMRRVFVLIPSALEIPNVFTPNNDGVNDVFYLHAAALSEVYMSITNRWGETVYELNSGSGNISWNGQNQRGLDVAEGVYLYTLKARGADGKTFDQQGNITLIR